MYVYGYRKLHKYFAGLSIAQSYQSTTTSPSDLTHTTTTTLDYFKPLSDLRESGLANHIVLRHAIALQ